MSVKNEMIDADHKRLIGLVNTFHEALLDKQGAKVLGVVFDELIDYAGSHFDREEKLMENTAFPYILEHKAEHEKLTEETNILRKKFASESTGITLETMDFLRNWLFNHIMKSDYQLSQWVAKS